MDKPMLTMGEKSPDHLTRARHHNDSHRRGVIRHWKQLDAVEALFGRPVAQVLRDEVEMVNENAGEAFYSYEEAIKERDHREADLCDGIRRHLETERSLRLRIEYLFHDITARYRRSGKPLPQWITDMSEEPF